MDYIDIGKLNLVTKTGRSLRLTIHPFQYLDGRKPRLPRKSSKRYKLMKDTSYCFGHSFNFVKPGLLDGKYKVSITVASGNDSLGGADLDNYCKAILDGITATQKIWKDDRQVDELYINRIYIKKEASFITLKIEEIK